LLGIHPDWVKIGILGLGYLFSGVFNMPIARVNGINLNYKVEGKGESLLMIGGFNSERVTWIFQTRLFKKYFKVITFENRGSGKSSKPRNGYSIDTMMLDSIGLMDHLGIQKAHILGVSMGGLIAQELAIKHPERIIKLVLSTSYCRIDGSNGPTPEMLKFTQLPVRQMLDSMAEMMLNRSQFRMLLLPIAKVKNRLADISSIQGKLEAAYSHNTSKRLGFIRSATLVIAGDSDRLIKPESSDEISKLIPGSKLVKIPRGSHMYFLEMSRQFNKEVLAFLLQK
jgi:3-oxoadipate enol-lactonase